MTANRPVPTGCRTIDEIQEGLTLRRTYTVTDEMVRKFSEISGDWNPAHHDEEYAAGTVFKARIAHGILSVAQFSGLFGMDLPGLGAIWTQQGVRFLAPVYLDRPYDAVIRAARVDREKNTVLFECWVEDARGNRVLEGEGTLKPIPARVREKMDPSRLPTGATA